MRLQDVYVKAIKLSKEVKTSSDEFDDTMKKMCEGIRGAEEWYM
jgi:hypothetical protein